MAGESSPFRWTNRWGMFSWLGQNILGNHLQVVRSGSDTRFKLNIARLYATVVDERDLDQMQEWPSHLVMDAITHDPTITDGLRSADDLSYEDELA